MNVVTGVLRFLLILVLIPFVYFLATVTLPGAGRERFREIIETWSGKLLSCMGVRVSVRGGRPARPAGKGMLVVSNHISFLDIFVIDSILCSRFVAKAEIGGWPVFGAISRGTRTIFIERGRRRAILEVASVMEKSLEGGENVIFFPEGTTSEGAGLLPFHANLIEAAVATGSAIQPVTLRYTSRGERTARMAYVGGVSIFKCLWNVVTTPDAGVEVTVLPALRPDGRSRHDICRELSGAMSASLGVEDPALLTSRARTKGGTAP